MNEDYLFDPEDEAVELDDRPEEPDAEWETALALAPMSTSTYQRHGMTIITSRPRPTHTTTTATATDTITPTTTNTQPEEAPMHEDHYAASEADENVGLIECWTGGHAPGSTHVPLDAIARSKAIAKYGPERGRLPINISNAARAFRKVIVERAAKDEMTKMSEMTVVLNTLEYTAPNVAWLSTHDQVRFFGLTDLDTTIPRLAGHPVEVVAVLFTAAKLRPFVDKQTGRTRMIPSDFDPASYVQILGCWQYMDDATTARDRLEDAVKAQINASRTAEVDDDSEAEWDDEEGEYVTEHTPVDVFGSA